MENKYEDCIHSKGYKCEALTVKYCTKEGCECSFYTNRQMARMTCGNCKHHIDGFCQIQRKKTVDVKRCNIDSFVESEVTE